MFKINKKLGISELEAPRLYLTWTTRFLFQIGFVVAWTIVTALFVERFGIGNLLFLFLADAILYAMGALLASFLLHRLDFRILLLCGIGITLTLIGVSLFLDSTSLPFFLCVILAKDMFFSQINITLYRRSEHLFSPSEAQKFMPIIESAITLGAIFGAGLTILFLEILPTQFVLTVWMSTLLIMGGIIFITPRLLHSFPHFRLPSLKVKKLKNPLIEAIAGVKKIPFLRHILIILLLQSAVFTIIEFEFTKDVQSHILPAHEETHAFDFRHLETSLFEDFKTKIWETKETIQKEATKVTSHLIMHKTLAHDLGAFHLLFGLLALFVQCMMPKILQKLGVVGSMVSYFFVLLVSLAATLLGYMHVNVLRAWQHGTHSLGEAPYHLSFYSIFSHNRESVRLFLEGIIKPFGIILGVICLWFFPKEIIFLFAAGATGIMIFLCLPMKKSYTKLSQENLQSDQDIEGKLHSIEVLGQKGHHDQGIVLANELEKKDLHNVIRDKIIQTISQVNDPRAVHTYIQILRNKSEDETTKISILDSLFRLDIPEQYWTEHAFTRYHLLETLKKLFEITQKGHLRKLIVMNIFRHLPNHEVVPFFLETMKQADDKLKSIYLRSCKMFRDPEITFYVRRYLNHSNRRIRSHAVIALWKFYDREELRNVLNNFFDQGEEGIIAVLYALGEIKDESYQDLLMKYKDDSSPLIKLHALIALAKMKNYECTDGLLEILFGDDRSLSEIAFRMMDRVPQEIQDHLQKEIQYEVSQQVSDILKPHNIKETQELKTLPRNILQHLRHLYWISNRHDDLLAIDHFS
jgi:hypothetical protein